METAHRYLPLAYDEEPPRVEAYDSADRADEALRLVVPDDPNEAYDMRNVVKRVVDGHSLLEISPDYARNVVTAFARLNGRVVGVVANDPATLAGCLDIDASVKAAKFVRFCDAFGVPLLTFVDVPGFLPGVRQEHGGIIRHGAKLLFASGAAARTTDVLRRGRRRRATAATSRPSRAGARPPRRREPERPQVRGGVRAQADGHHAQGLRRSL